MKKILIILCAVFICGVSIAQTIRWHIGDTVYETTTCNAGESITPPTAPEKFGYSFVKWKLPYTPIEYLESTGVQYIDTGVIIEQPSSMNGTSVKFQVRELSTQENTNAIICGGVNNSGTGAYYNLQSIVYSQQFSTGTGGFDYSQSSNIYMDTIATTNTNAYYNVNTSFLLFARNRNTLGPQIIGKIRIYNSKIYKNGALVRDFIPVLDSNNVPCMYDRVEKKFYYNAGTGQFIAGPVIGE